MPSAESASSRAALHDFTASSSATPAQPTAVPLRAHDEVIGTAEGSCLARAAAACDRDPTVANPDYLAKHFLGPFYRLGLTVWPVWLLRRLMEWKLPGGYGSHTARTHHGDRLLHAALVGGAQQVVILGAGYDTRAYRFREQLANVPVFEVDLPGTQARKKRRLQAVFGALPSHVRYVPIDFARQRLEQVLSAAGYDPALQTHFNWEGVTYYIDEPAVSRVLTFVREHAAPGSAIGFDYWPRSFVEGDLSTYGARQLVKYAVEENHEPFLFGLNADEIAPYLERHGFDLVSDLGPDELSARYLYRRDGSLLARPWDVMRFAYARTRS